MTIESQVVSLELAKRLKELGVRQSDSLYVWWEYSYPASVQTRPYIAAELERITTVTQDVAKKLIYAAFTVAELGEMLPKVISFQPGVVYLKTDDTESDDRAKCLIQLLENKLVTL